MRRTAAVAALLCCLTLASLADEIVRKDGGRTLGVIIQEGENWVNIVNLEGEEERIEKARIAETVREALPPGYMKILLEAVRKRARAEFQAKIERLRKEVRKLETQLAAAPGQESPKQAKRTSVKRPRARYSILRRWKPNRIPNGLGLEVLLKDDLGKEEIISFVRNLSAGKDPVIIRVFTSLAAYREERNNEYGEEYGRGYILFYVRNKTGQGLYNGFDEIRWMQEVGKFSHLFGQKSKF